jgi:hypothetical protein
MGNCAGGCEGRKNRVENDADSYLSALVALTARN